MKYIDIHKPLKFAYPQLSLLTVAKINPLFVEYYISIRKKNIKKEDYQKLKEIIDKYKNDMQKLS